MVGARRARPRGRARGRRDVGARPHRSRATRRGCGPRAAPVASSDSRRPPGGSARVRSAATSTLPPTFATDAAWMPGAGHGIPRRATGRARRLPRPSSSRTGARVRPRRDRGPRRAAGARRTRRPGAGRRRRRGAGAGCGVRGRRRRSRGGPLGGRPAADRVAGGPPAGVRAGPPASARRGAECGGPPGPLGAEGGVGCRRCGQGAPRTIEMPPARRRIAVGGGAGDRSRGPRSGIQGSRRRSWRRRPPRILA